MIKFAAPPPVEELAVLEDHPQTLLDRSPGEPLAVPSITIE